KKNAQVRLGIISITGSKTTWVEWDRKKYEYLAQVVWGKHGPLTIVLQDRKQQRMVSLDVSRATGKTAEWASWESRGSSSWVNIDPSLPRWLPNGMYLTETEDRLRVVTPGQYSTRLDLPLRAPFRGLVSVDEKGREIAFLVT